MNNPFYVEWLRLMYCCRYRNRWSKLYHLGTKKPTRPRIRLHYTIRNTTYSLFENHIFWLVRLDIHSATVWSIYSTFLWNINVLIDENGDLVDQNLNLNTYPISLSTANWTCWSTVTWRPFISCKFSRGNDPMSVFCQKSLAFT